MSSFTTVLRTTNWANDRQACLLSETLVWQRDFLRWTHVSSWVGRTAFCWECSSLLFMRFHAFWYPLSFFPERWKLQWHEFEPKDLRNFSLNTHLRSSKCALASYMCFLSRKFFWRIQVVWPNIFSSWVRQKSWTAMWAVITSLIFLYSGNLCCF